MKPVIRLKIDIMILCLFLIVLGSLYCGRGSDQSVVQESKITLLCFEDNEQSVFRDGKSTMFLMFLPLVFEDEEGRAQPGLLERWEHSDDYTEWTFHLRKDVKWHDGKPVTAQDVKFTLELLIDPNIMYGDHFFKEITIIDTFTCSISSNRPFNPLPYCNWYPICPEHLLGSLDTAKFLDWEFWKQPVGNGPYRYIRHVANTMVELEVNPDYYREKPKIERVMLKFGTNPVTELMSGNVDAVNNLPPHEVMKMAKDPRFNIYHEFLYNRAVTIVWNRQNPLFQNPTVRRALTLAINRHELHRVLNLPDTTPVFDAAFHKSQFYRGELPEPLPYDPGQAKKLLEEVGWVEKTKGSTRENNGRKFHFTLFVCPEYSMEAIYIQDQLRKVGIRMEVMAMETILVVGRGNSGDFEAYLCIMYPFNYQAHEGKLYNPEFIRLLKAATLSPTIDELDKTVRKLWPKFRAEIPFTFLYPDIKFNIVHKRIRGLKSPHRAYPSKFMEYLWIEEEK
jgi:ABC-type transport system substrate-binding protein